jgi:hypothetical protein
MDSAGLLDALRRLRLLEPARLDELARRPGGDDDPRALARALVRRGWLTPYQADRLLGGRGDDLVLGPYALLEPLGEGGMGEVFKARHLNLGRVAALKVLRPDLLRRPNALRRFRREVRAAARLAHPNVVRAYDAGESGGRPFLVMEYVEGVDLARLVHESGPLEVAQACEYVRQSALGLQHAHAHGLVHRDVKPSNLLLTPDGVVKLLDLGLARLSRPAAGERSGDGITRDGVTVGTPDFLAPEQARASRAADARADLYALGCTLYFLLTGPVPFPGVSVGEKLLRHQTAEPEPLERLRPEVPPAVVAVVRKLMAKEPADRYQTSAELADALARWEEPAAKVPASVWAEAVGPAGARRRPVPASGRRGRRALAVGLAAAGLTGLVLAGALAVSLRSRVPPAAVRGPAPGGGATVEGWAREVSALPAEEQAGAVAQRLKERNPGFDGVVKATVVRGAVKRLEVAADHVTDLGPARALPGLVELHCRGSAPGKGRLADLSPLKGLRLVYLNCGQTRVRDLSPLADMPLLLLQCDSTEVVDLSPLKGTPLKTLYCHGTAVKDLSPLRGLRLTALGCARTPVADLSPLRGMPLTSLDCSRTAVADLGPLRGMPLASLDVRATRVADLSPLRGLPLKELRGDFVPGRDAEALRALGQLERINGKPAGQFLAGLRGGR